ncbi:LysR family transcriptional regulator [Aliigemmobacter aestuarii]|uniref:LysR family transcriptional regulator n=1 Tax=Aliigemmobacter aestuarii TaxID=1445661 RepID=UPI001454C9BC|nr:LysR family transcriptional regulator [Gemmobacter aestuarii]
MLSVTLRQLEYAVAVARHGTVTAAAEALAISQPALSVAIAQLEAQLGKLLFLRRSGGPITPTSFGRDFLDQAEARLVDIGRLMQGEAVSALPVRLAVFEDLAPVLLAPILARLVPTDLPVAPVVRGFEDISEGLRRGQIDLAVTYDLGLPLGTTRQELARLPPHAVLAAAHPLAARAGVSLAELAAEPLLLADQGLSLGHMRALFARRGLSPRVAHRTATLELMRSFAANGMGVGLSYTRPAPAESYDGRPLVTRPILDAGPGEPVVLAMSDVNPLSHAAQTLSRALEGVAALLA